MRVHWLSPGDPSQRTGGFLYNRRIIDGLRERGAQVTVHPLPGSWPWPTPSELARCEALLAGVEGGVIVADGLCWTGLGALGARLAANRTVIVLLHSPLHAEDDREEVRRAEGRALRGVFPVATSPTTARALQIHAQILIPGTDPPPSQTIPRIQPEGGPISLLMVATLTRRKAHDVLLQALSRLDRSDWVLRCAGAPRDPAWAEALREHADQLGLSDRVHWLGDLDEGALQAVYRSSDVLVQAAHYEAWGMALAEGFARGMAVISTPAGILEGADPRGWRAVSPGDPEGLADALRAVLEGPALRERLRGAAREIGRSLPRWEEQIGRWYDMLRRLEVR